jgi:NAD(P)H dehydrogenase (quinone)
MLLIFKRVNSMNQADILVSGATGRTGGAAIDELLTMGKRVRAYVRSDDERAAVLRKRGVDVAVGDFTAIDDIRAAMEGIGSAYFLHPIAPGIIGAAAFFAQAAKEAGVTAIVNMSQISARRESRSHAAQDHWVSERVFDWSGVPTTHLRPTFFAEWLIYPQFAQEIWATKKIEFPFENGRHAPISADDQGRVIAHLLANPAGHEGKIYTLHGPVEMNHTEIAAAMSEVLETKIEYAPSSIEEFKRKMEELYKFPPFLAQHLVEVAQNYREGIFAGTNDVVEKITGRPALSVRAFIEKHRKVYA